MKSILTEEQTSFFSRHGSIEFELDNSLLDTLPLQARDNWRGKESLKQFLLKKIGKIALTLTGKKQLRLGCDEFIQKGHFPKKGGPLQQLFSLQGSLIGAIFCKETPLFPKKRAPLGILPLPSAKNHVLFVKSHLILDWPSIENDLYIVLFVEQNAVYRENLQDAQTHYLKPLGFHFGDLLKNETHPIILG